MGAPSAPSSKTSEASDESGVVKVRVCALFSGTPLIDLIAAPPAPPFGRNSSYVIAPGIRPASERSAFNGQNGWMTSVVLSTTSVVVLTLYPTSQNAAAPDWSIDFSWSELPAITVDRSTSSVNEISIRLLIGQGAPSGTEIDWTWKVEGVLLPLPLPPEPVRFPRTKLSLRLAVLLLRSGYETVDAMDILPMDQFQVKFWKSRQAEWEPYKFQYAPLVIEQGKLEDPLYFDFISYVQFEVVAREMPKSAGVFEERSGAEGTTKVVRRDPSLADNAILPAVLAQRLGDTIYARLRYGFEDTAFPGCPEPARLGDEFEANAATMEKGVAALTKCMVDKGYGLRSDVAVVDMKQEKRRVRMRIVVEGVANLWGAQALAARGVSPPNEYLGFALTAYCRASGVGSFYAAKATDTAVEIELTVTMP